MLRQLLTLIVLSALATPVAADQQEAELQRIELPGGVFDLLLATPKFPSRMVYDLSESPEALIVRLIGNELVLTFEDPEKMLKAVTALGSPAGAFHAVSRDGKSRTPFVIYLVRKGE